MTVRRTESRLPAGFHAADLGQACVVPGNGLDEGYALVSYLTSPVPIASFIDYVVFVATGEDVQSYDWRFENIATGVVQATTTDIGLFSYFPSGLDLYQVSVVLHIAGGSTVTLSLIQEVRPRFTGFEFFFNAPPLPNPKPGATLAALGGDAVATEELTNDMRTYVLDAAAATDLPARFLGSVAYDGAMRAPKHDKASLFAWTSGRDEKLESVASELNGDGDGFFTDIDDPVGICQLSLATMALVVGPMGLTGNPYVAWKEKAADGSDESTVAAELQAAFDALSDDAKVDLFNLARFPRTDIELCAALLVKLRDRPTRWPGKTDDQLLTDAFALPTLATELRGGADKGARPTAAAVAGETVLTGDGKSIVGLGYLPALMTLFPDLLQAGADAYGGLDLRRGVADAPHVTQLQQDLDELGFALVGNPNGVFGATTEWAVREFQIYAKMRFLASDTGVADPRYVARLQQTLNLYHYSGPICGVVNVGTRILIQLWKTNNWRCPVVIEAWDTDLPTIGTNTVPSWTTPSAGLGNIWLHDEAPPIPAPPIPAPPPSIESRADSRLMFARDFTGHYDFPPAHAQDLTDPDSMIDVGCAFRSGNSTGPLTRPGGRYFQRTAYSSVWPEAEILPDNLLGVPLANLTPAQFTTYRVVRAVSEVECLGFFDSVNCWDTAFVSMGPSHWTLGLSNPIAEGELCGYLSYLSAFDPVAFVQAFESYGMRIDEPWIDATGDRSGRTLFDRDQRKFTSWVALQGEDGRYSRQFFNMEDANYFRTWHWAYRFIMAGRTIPGFQTGMWDMIRIRLRDITTAPIPAALNVPDVPAAGGATRRATIGDCFTSEKATGMLLRWHIFRPFDMCTNGEAGARVQAAITAAGLPGAAGDPTTWSQANETALVAALRAESANINASADTKKDLNRALGWVMTWPVFDGRAGHNYQLDPNIPALSDTRGSFRDNFDDSGLPPAVV